MDKFAILQTHLMHVCRMEEYGIIFGNRWKGDVRNEAIQIDPLFLFVGMPGGLYRVYQRRRKLDCKPGIYKG